MKPIILALFLLGSSLGGSALAQTASNSYPKIPIPAPMPNPRVAQLETALNHVQQEQQAVYQQFQMTQELRRNEIQQNYPQGIQPADSMAAYAMGGLKDNPPQSYDDNVRMQRERQERIEQYTRDLNRLYSRYAELGEQKRVLLDQLIELAK